MTTTTSNYQEVVDLKRARVRCWGVGISHFFLAPVASVVYAAKTDNWLPTAIATGVFVVGMPLALFDIGITAGIVAPATSAIMFINKTQESRRKLGIISAEEADAKLFTRRL